MSPCPVLSVQGGSCAKDVADGAAWGIQQRSEQSDVSELIKDFQIVAW